MVGFWDEPGNPEEAVEGLARDGGYAFYKAHQSHHQLTGGASLGTLPFKLLYVVRDVRDVVLSAARYFDPLLFYPWFSFLAGRRFTGPVQRVLRSRSQSHQQAVFRLVSEGGMVTWLEIPWGKHVEAYLEAGVVLVKYEDLLVDPFAEVSRVLSSLGLPVVDSAIEEACEEQSFDSKKQSLMRAGLKDKVAFLKVGKSKQWESDLSSRVVSEVESRFGVLLERLGYPAR